MAITAQLETKPSAGRQYWTHNVGDFTGPVAQFRMSQLVDYDQRLTDPARTVYRFLIGWYVRGHGDALASVRHIVATMRTRAPDGARHLSRSAVQRAIILLMDTGWLVRRYTGKGRSGSRYVPVLNVLELAAQGTLPQPANDSVPPHRDTTAESVASHFTGTVVSHHTGTLTEIASRPTGTKTLLPDPRTDAGTGEERYDCAPPSAPPGSAPCGPTGADGHKEEKTQLPFDDLWRAYGHRQKRADAKAAYEAASPDADLHQTMMEAATAWHEHWTRQNDAHAPRRTLASWIKAECFHEDPPAGYQPKEKPVKAKAEKSVGAVVDPVIEASEPGSPRSWPKGRHVLKIVDSKVEQYGRDEELTLTFEIMAGNLRGQQVQHSFFVSAFVESVQNEGQAYLRKIMSSAEVDFIVENSNQLHGLSLAAEARDGRIAYDRLTDEELDAWS